MCLDRLLPDEKPCDYGYKVFVRQGRQVYTPFQGWVRHVPKSRKVHEIDYRAGYRAEDLQWIRSTNGSSYPAGWHVFHNKDDAVSYADGGVNAFVYRVRVGKPLAVGEQDIAGEPDAIYSLVTGHEYTIAAKVTVCKYITRLEEVKD